ITEDSLIVVEKVKDACLAKLRSVLAGMNFPDRPGTADPRNALVPFEKFETIHFARFVVLADNTLGDRVHYPQLPREEPTYLCFMVDCDGDADALVSRMADKCPGFSNVFAACEGFDAKGDI